MYAIINLVCYKIQVNTWGFTKVPIFKFSYVHFIFKSSYDTTICFLWGSLFWNKFRKFSEVIYYTWCDYFLRTLPYFVYLNNFLTIYLFRKLTDFLKLLRENRIFIWISINYSSNFSQLLTGRLVDYFINNLKVS